MCFPGFEPVDGFIHDHLPAQFFVSGLIVLISE